MESWTDQIKKILDRAPTRALPFSRLLGALRKEGLSLSGREEWVLRSVAEQPAIFKVIPDRLGPWALWPFGKGGGFPESFPGSLGPDPWIMACSPASSGFDTEGRAMDRILESLQAWGKEIDDGSQAAVARWIAANQETERAFEKVFREWTVRV